MQCERLIKQVKTWYLHVKEETMAPARMVQFMKQHVESCSICQEETGIHDEIDKITELILPESKIPKAVRLKQELEEAKLRAEQEAEEDSGNSEKSEKSENTAEDASVEDEVEEPLTPDSTTV